MGLCKNGGIAVSYCTLESQRSNAAPNPYSVVRTSWRKEPGKEGKSSMAKKKKNVTDTCLRRVVIVVHGLTELVRRSVVGSDQIYPRIPRIEIAGPIH